VIWQQRCNPHIITVQSHFERTSHREKNHRIFGCSSVSVNVLRSHIEGGWHAESKLPQRALRTEISGG
jgi:hypothetical protein